MILPMATLELKRDVFMKLLKVMEQARHMEVRLG